MADLHAAPDPDPEAPAPGPPSLLDQIAAARSESRKRRSTVVALPIERDGRSIVGIRLHPPARALPTVVERQIARKQGDRDPMADCRELVMGQPVVVQLDDQGEETGDAGVTLLEVAQSLKPDTRATGPASALLEIYTFGYADGSVEIDAQKLADVADIFHMWVLGGDGESPEDASPEA